MADGGARQQFQRRVVQNFSTRHDAAMAMHHVFAQADVGDDQQRRQFLFQQPDGLLHDAVLRISARGLPVLLAGDAEQQNRRNAEGVGAGRFADQFIRRKLKDPGHGLDGTAHFFAGAREQRQHQLLNAQPGFGHEPAQRGRLPQPARARHGKSGQCHGSSLVFVRAVQSAKFTGQRTGVRSLVGNEPTDVRRLRSTGF